MRHVALIDDQWVGLVGYGSAALTCSARDRWVGWSPENRYRRLRFVANNQRFCILPAGRYPNVASAVLAASLRRLDADWQRSWGHPIRRALPNVTIVVDHWHIDKLANLMLTQVRQRAARDQYGRRGRKNDLTWAHRQLLLRAGDGLSERARVRLEEVFANDDPSGQIKAAWLVKEALRNLLEATDRHTISNRLYAFYDAVIAADLPEATRLATTIQRWWPELLAFLQTRITNSRTEGYNRVIKQIKRVGCGYRNQTNYERRILLNIAAKRAA